MTTPYAKVQLNVLALMFDLLEYQRVLESHGDLTLIPEGARNDLLTQLLASVKNPLQKK